MQERLAPAIAVAMATVGGFAACGPGNEDPRPFEQVLEALVTTDASGVVEARLAVAPDGGERRLRKWLESTEDRARGANLLPEAKPEIKNVDVGPKKRTVQVVFPAHPDLRLMAVLLDSADRRREMVKFGSVGKDSPIPPGVAELWRVTNWPDETELTIVIARCAKPELMLSRQYGGAVARKWIEEFQGLFKSQEIDANRLLLQVRETLVLDKLPACCPD